MCLLTCFAAHVLHSTTWARQRNTLNASTYKAVTQQRLPTAAYLLHPSPTCDCPMVSLRALSAAWRIDSPGWCAVCGNVQDEDDAGCFLLGLPSAAAAVLLLLSALCFDLTSRTSLSCSRRFMVLWLVWVWRQWDEGSGHRE